MLKVSFKDDCMKVQTFNNKATVVTIVGELIIPNKLLYVLPPEIHKWINDHPAVDATSYALTNLKVSGKSVCSDEDTFNAETGKRIAESRAKIRLYKFMHTLCTKILLNFYGLMYGVPEGASAIHTAVISDSHGGLREECKKYATLWVKESQHLGKLLEEA